MRWYNLTIAVGNEVNSFSLGYGAALDAINTLLDPAGVLTLRNDLLSVHTYFYRSLKVSYWCIDAMVEMENGKAVSVH